MYRGKSKNPLYITTVGVDRIATAQLVQEMKGAYRMPDLLRILDQETKK